MHICKKSTIFAAKINDVIMKRIVLVSALMALSVGVFATQYTTYLDYIAKWKGVAIRHQQEYGVPASITLAQGLLESAAGQSELATEANNHFGIKCTSDWMGDVYRHDDDRKAECFRMYNDAEESFKDHALFLKRSRYERLFTYSVTDYPAWAQGLKDCGYATDPAYPKKLIRIIEEYKLNDYVLAAKDYKGESQATKTESASKTDSVVVLTAAPVIASFSQDPEPPYVRPLTAKEEKSDFFAHHGKGKCNGVRYTIAREGDTYASMAFSLNVTERSLREHNDALGREMKAGDRVYMGKKKKQAPKDHLFVWVKPGQSVWELIQKECITEKAFRELNGLPVDVRVFETRQQVLLRKPKDK